MNVGLDRAVEQAGRWAAGRLTRRSLLGRLGQVGILVAGGPTLVSLLAEPAGARVCGQTGVSPTCPTYDCDDVWGWCWYATGCCSDGLLKKICDCCAVAWPNVHGYCPTGTNVKCIVESCGTDPRVQTARVVRIDTDDHYAAEEAVRRQRFPNGSATVVAGDATSPLWAAVAVPVAARLGVPLLTVSMSDPDATLYRPVRELGAVDVLLVAPHVPGTVVETLGIFGVGVRRLGSSTDLATFSVEVASWLVSARGAEGAVAISAQGLSAQAAPLAAALGGSLGWPLLVDPPGRGAGVPVVTVGPEAGAVAPESSRVHATASADLVAIANEFVDLADRLRPLGTTSIVVAPRQTPALLALAGLGEPIVLTEQDSLDGGRERIRARVDRYRIGRLFLGGHRSRMGDGPYREAQSILNGYEAHRLIGGAGQGLPVYEQPPSERPVGRARLGADPAPLRRASEGDAVAATVPGGEPSFSAAATGSPAPPAGPLAAGSGTSPEAGGPSRDWLQRWRRLT